ncbi:MAG: chromate transporter, partial [Sarcina sp.]
MNTALEMFFSFLKIGAFTFGGGYAMIPLIQEEVVNKRYWLTKEEFMDALIVAQSLPGVLAVNCSTYIGYKVSGLKGALLALLGTILPSILIILVIAKFFMGFRHNYYVNLAFKGISAAVPMLVLMGVISLFKTLKKTTINYIVISLAVVALTIFNIHPVIVIISGA